MHLFDSLSDVYLSDYVTNMIEAGTMIFFSYICADCALEHGLGIYRRRTFSREVGRLRNYMLLFSAKRLSKHKIIFVISRGLFHLGCILVIKWMVSDFYSIPLNRFDSVMSAVCLGAYVFLSYPGCYFAALENKAYHIEDSEADVRISQEEYEAARLAWKENKNDPSIAQSKKQKMLYRQAYWLNSIAGYACTAKEHGSSIDLYSMEDWIYSELQKLNQDYAKFDCTTSIDVYSMFWVFPEEYIKEYYREKTNGNTVGMRCSINGLLVSSAEAYENCYINTVFSQNSIKSVEQALEQLEQLIADFQNTEQYAGDSECQEEIFTEIKALAIIRECCKNKKELPDEW